MTKRNRTPFAVFAAWWAQQMGLPAGNLWEPGIVRNMERAHAELGGDEDAHVQVVNTWAMRLFGYQPEYCDDCGKIVGYYDPTLPEGDKIIIEAPCYCWAPE